MSQNEKIWFGRMTDEQRKQGGIWTIGNNPYDPRPEYPGRNNGSLLVKSWVANLDKYGPGCYKLKNRIEDAMQEYVKVFTGCLELITGEETAMSKVVVPLEYPDEGVDLAPIDLRCWHLPVGCPQATGITICRAVPYSPTLQAGNGSPLYEYWPFDSSAPSSFDRLWRPYFLKDWRIRYVEVFEGSLDYSADTAGVMYLGDHCFTFDEKYTRFFRNNSPGVRGVVIYMK